MGNERDSDAILPRPDSATPAEPEEAPCYRAADWEIDPHQCCVRRSGQSITLRNKSLQVLLYLVEQRSRLVKKEELLGSIWKDTAVTDDALVGCILEIRKALGDEARSPRFIKTFPKLGYRFIAPVAILRPDGTAISDPPAVKPSPKPLRWILAAIVGCIILVAAWILTRTSPSTPPQFEVAWWKLDEGTGTEVRDSSGNQLHGRLKGTPAWEAGRMGNALRLNGVDAIVQGEDTHHILPRGDSPRTLAAWIKTSSTNGDVTAILNYGEPTPFSDASFLLLLQPDGKPAFSQGAYGERLRGLVAGQSRVDDGEWHQVTGVFSGGSENSGALFVDGSRQGVVKMRQDRKEDKRRTPWAIGSNLWSGTAFRGVVDDVRIYSRALRSAEISALYRCGSGQTDIVIPGRGAHFFFPVWAGPDGRYTTVAIGPSAIRNIDTDYAGVQIAKPNGDCGLATLRGADLGQDLEMEVELLVPTDALGRGTQAGPYFRARRAVPGDGLQGGSNAGYWVQLHSSGAVVIRQLNSSAVVAFTKPITSFDASAFHKLAIAARGVSLEAALDNKRLTFDQSGEVGTAVRLPENHGDNGGAAGIAFGCESTRGLIGGEQARNLKLSTKPETDGTFPGFPN